MGTAKEVLSEIEAASDENGGGYAHRRIPRDGSKHSLGLEFHMRRWRRWTRWHAALKSFDFEIAPV